MNMVVVPNNIYRIILSRHLSLEQLDRHFDERAAAKEPTELFTKNIGLC